MDGHMPYDNVLTIEDGNVLFYHLKDIPNSLKEICKKLYRITGTKSYVLVSTDTYSGNLFKWL